MHYTYVLHIILKFVCSSCNNNLPPPMKGVTTHSSMYDNYSRKIWWVLGDLNLPKGFHIHQTFLLAIRFASLGRPPINKSEVVLSGSGKTAISSSVSSLSIEMVTFSPFFLICTSCHSLSATLLFTVTSLCTPLILSSTYSSSCHHQNTYHEREVRGWRWVKRVREGGR